MNYGISGIDSNQTALAAKSLKNIWNKRNHNTYLEMAFSSKKTKIFIMHKVWTKYHDIYKIYNQYQPEDLNLHKDNKGNGIGKLLSGKSNKCQVLCQF